MKTMEIAYKLADLCRRGKNDEAPNTLFADNVVSVEAAMPARGEGTGRCQGKGRVVAGQS